MCSTIVIYILLRMNAHLFPDYFCTQLNNMCVVFFFFVCMQGSNTTTVDDIDLYVTSTYGEELYNSCKNVKFGTMNTRAMDFIGGGAQNYKGLSCFLVLF